MHEFEEVMDVPAEIEKTPNSKKVLNGAKQVERVAYRFAKALGSEKYLD